MPTITDDRIADIDRIEEERFIMQEIGEDILPQSIDDSWLEEATEF